MSTGSLGWGCWTSIYDARCSRMWRTVVLFISCVPLIISTSCSRPAHPNRAVWIKIANVDDLHSDGSPKRCDVMVSAGDSQSTGADKPIAAVFVRRNPADGKVSALHEVHCHGSMPIRAEYDADASCYRSCCWKVQFDLDGHEIASLEQSAMGDRMPPAPVRIENDQIFVLFSPLPCLVANSGDAMDSR